MPRVRNTPPATPPAPAASPAPATSTTPTASDSSIAAGLAATAPVATGSDPTGAELVKKLAAADKLAGEKIVDILVKPTKVSSTEVSYKLNRKLEPGQSIYFAVPAELAKGELSFMVLTHAAQKSEDTDTNPDDKWDDTPALTSVQVHASNVAATDAWRYWGGDSSGNQGAKFAEFRAESENLYEWKNKGHVGVKSGQSKYTAIHVDAIRVRSVGQDPVHIHEIGLKIAPPKADQHQDVIFSPGASLGDVETHAGAEYDFGHRYPGALPLGGAAIDAATKAKLPEGWTASGSTLEIPLPAGKKLSFVDVACGDVHQVKGADGKYEPQKKSSGDIQRGWARLSIGVKGGSGQTTWFMSGDNVPSKGILTAAPNDPNYLAKAGDKILIHSASDTTWVMAVRVGTRD